MKTYLDETSKLLVPEPVPWTLEECDEITNTLYSKGYEVICVTRLGCDRKFHEAWQVYREDIPRLIEQLFRQRIVVEVQAEGSYNACINFVYDHPAGIIIEAVNRFQKNKKVKA